MNRHPFHFFLWLAITLTVSSLAQELAPAEAKRKALVEKQDQRGLRFSRQAVIDRSQRMLAPPSSISRWTGFTVAATPPEIEFVLAPVQPRFFDQPPDGYFSGVWSNWSQGAYHSTTKKFFSAIGSHRFYKPLLYLFEYDAVSRSIRRLPEINAALGRADAEYGDGKIHGWLDFYNQDELFFCTYWCQYPEPSEKEFLSGYEGGCLLSYNVMNGRFTDYGVPVPRASWPYHRLDTRRGMMYAVGMFGEFLAFDVSTRRIRWAGYPPPGLRWYWRTMLIDEETGLVYSTNNLRQDSSVHMIRYDPVKNRFFKMNATVPPDTIADDRAQMRAHIRSKRKDGSFIAVSLGGRLFSFYPEKDRVQDLGDCWPGPHRYTTSLAMSPDEKYVYYMPAAHGQAYLEGAPLIQYNTHSGERKVLAFLHPFYYEKYGYIPGGTFSVVMDDKGETLFLVLNGAFAEYDPQGGDVFGDPSILVVHIPESER